MGARGEGRRKKENEVGGRVGEDEGEKWLWEQGGKERK